MLINSQKLYSTFFVCHKQPPKSLTHVFKVADDGANRLFDFNIEFVGVNLLVVGRTAGAQVLLNKVLVLVGVSVGSNDDRVRFVVFGVFGGAWCALIEVSLRASIQGSLRALHAFIHGSLLKLKFQYHEIDWIDVQSCIVE